MGYAFRPDVYWCIANRRVVLLDLSADRYSALPTEADEAFQEWLANDFAAAPAALSSWIAAGLLVKGNGQRPQSASIPPPRVSRLPTHGHIWDCSGIIDAWVTQTRIAHALKKTPLITLISDIRQKKAAHTSRTLSDPFVTHAIRTYLRSARAISNTEECLRWSLAMVRFLRRRQYFPNLVLGVRMMPFAAHAWVQDGDTVLNDSVEQVSAYTPILVV